MNNNENKYDKTAGCAVYFSGFLFVVFSVLTIITKIVADNSSSYKTSVYILGQYIGQNSWHNLYNTIFYCLLFISVLMLALVLFSVKRNKKNKEYLSALNKESDKEDNTTNHHNDFS